MSFELPKLPYKLNALEPYITENTLNFHYGKHHQAYLNNLNNLVKDTDLEGKTLEIVILDAANNANKVGVFNNAAQVWNHTFYWNSMMPGGGGEPKGKLREQIEKDFNGYQNFKEQFAQAGMTQFGSGWAWLVLEDGKLKITKTSNADLPIIHKQKPIITADVWEHAYYLDYQNRRNDYLAIFLDNLVNWEFAELNFTS
jgi:Fe-Mn family superoxide dismutase